MPSAQDCAERLREQAYRTLLPQIRDLEKALQNVSRSLSTGIEQIEQKLDALSHIELPTTEWVLTEILGDVTRDTASKASALAQFARNLRQFETQEEILGSLLDAVCRYLPRTALFAVRGNRFVGWSSRGFAETIAREISSTSFPRSLSPKFEETVHGGQVVTAADLLEDAPLHFLKDEMPGTCCLVPLLVLDRPVALLMAGGAECSQNAIDTLSILVETAVLRLENVALKVLHDLTAAQRDAGSAQGEPMPAAEPRITPEPASLMAQESPVPEIPEPPSEPATTFNLDSYAKPAVPEEPEPASEEKLLVQPQAPVESLPDREPEQAHETHPLPEEEKLHSDAKRFARLLVQEIKLYNEHHVVEGRENQDIYLRLKRDIDRSREMYEKRVSPNVSRKMDYFHDEIIRILGDNDPSALGRDYPGPRVES